MCVRNNLVVLRPSPCGVKCGTDWSIKRGNGGTAIHVDARSMTDAAPRAQTLQAIVKDLHALQERFPDSRYSDGVASSIETVTAALNEEGEGRNEPPTVGDCWWHLCVCLARSRPKKEMQTAFSRPKVSRAAPPQLKQELMTYWQQCSGGDGESCLILAEAYESGRGFAKNDRYAADLYQRGCETGLSKGCYRAGMRHYKGLDGKRAKSRHCRFLNRPAK